MHHGLFAAVSHEKTRGVFEALAGGMREAGGTSKEGGEDLGLGPWPGDTRRGGHRPGKDMLAGRPRRRRRPVLHAGYTPGGTSPHRRAADSPPQGGTPPPARLFFMAIRGKGSWALGDLCDVGHMDMCSHVYIFIYIYA